jgi:hypothetical protein
MDTTDLRTLWAEQARRLDRAAARTEPLVRDLAVRRARSALWPALPVRALEGTLAMVAAIAITPVAFAHHEEPRYVLASALTLLWLLGLSFHAGRQFVLGLQLDAGAPVTATQTVLLRLRRAEFAGLRWAVLGGVFAWLPLGALLFESATSGPVLEQLPAPWLWANLALGLVAWTASPFIGRTIERKAQAGGAAARFCDALTSRGLRRAEAQLVELARFADDEPA